MLRGFRLAGALQHDQLAERIALPLQPIRIDFVCTGLTAVRADRGFELGIARISDRRARGTARLRADLGVALLPLRGDELVVRFLSRSR